MFQSLRKHVPHFSSWLDAERRYRQIEHCRTDAPLVRRLCDDGSGSYGRKNKNILLIRVHGGTKPSEDCFEVKYYNSVIARFYRNYYTISIEGYNTKSTKIILEKLTGATIKNFHSDHYIPETYPSLVVNNGGRRQYQSVEDIRLIPDITMTRDKLGNLAEAHAPDFKDKYSDQEQETGRYTDIKFPVEEWWAKDNKLIKSRKIVTVGDQPDEPDLTTRDMSLILDIDNFDFWERRWEGQEEECSGLETHTLRIPVRPISNANLIWFSKGVVPPRLLRGVNQFNTHLSGYLMDCNLEYKFHYDGVPVTRKGFRKFYKYKTDRRELHKARKNAQPFLDYTKGFLKLASEDGGETAWVEEEEGKYMGGLKRHEMYALVYWYCLTKKPKTVREFFDSVDIGSLWAEMLGATLQRYSSINQGTTYDGRKQVSCDGVLKDLDRIIKHANPRTLVRVS